MQDARDTECHFAKNNENKWLGYSVSRACVEVVVGSLGDRTEMEFYRSQDAAASWFPSLGIGRETAGIGAREGAGGARVAVRKFVGSKGIDDACLLEKVIRHPDKMSEWLID